MMRMMPLPWTGLVLTATQLLWWSRTAGQPTPAPTLFDGYDYTQCLIDVFQSDTNGDGFISNSQEEYLALINNVGASFCFSQTTPLTATQQNAYFTLVCELVPNCLITSEIPTNGLTRDQIIRICQRTRESIFTTCPEPTASPGAPAPTPPAPTPTPPSPTPPVVPPPSSTASPTLQFEPVADNITLAQCRQDLAAADVDSNERITEQEYLTFIDLMGLRVCYEREDTAFPTQAEADSFDALICLASQPCTGLTEIVVSADTFTPSLAFTLCSVTYFSAMGEPSCDDSRNSTLPNATLSPTTVSALTPAPQPGAGRPSLSGYTFTWVVGAATMLVYMWM